MPYVTCEQQRWRSACVSAQSDQCLFVRCLDSTKPLVSMYEIASLYLASVAAQAGLNLTWSETPGDTFSHDGALIYLFYIYAIETDCLSVWQSLILACVSHSIS